MVREASEAMISHDTVKVKVNSSVWILGCTLTVTSYVVRHMSCVPDSSPARRHLLVGSR